MALVGLLMALLAAFLVIGRFSGGSAPRPTGQAGSPAPASGTVAPAPPLNPAATLRSVEQVGAASSEAEKRRLEQANQAMP